jgi:hypothetical protein
MQKTSLRSENTFTLAKPFPIVHFPLEGLLPTSGVLALNVPLGTLSHISGRDGMPTLIEEQQFAPGEICLLRPLLEAHPHFCPSEVLLANLNSANASELDIARCRQRLQKALMAGRWSAEMAPVRNLLSRVRPKMHAFEIDIYSIVETGYILMSRPRQIKKEA